MVGYDGRKSLLYLAVQVRDDFLVVGGSDHLSNDACEVYVDGANSRAGVSFLRMFTGSAADLPVLQFVGLPGEGSYGSDNRGNPSLFRGDIGKTRTQMAYTRSGDTTIYEWAIQPFDHFSDQPTELVPGGVVGFDVVVVDKDSKKENPAWICWGSPAGGKYLDAGQLGEVVLTGRDGNPSGRGEQSENSTSGRKVRRPTIAAREAGA